MTIKWKDFDACMVAEGNFELGGYTADEMTREIYLSAWQHLIDTGLCWKLQGFFGRTARDLIEQGYCEPANEECEA